MELHEQEYVIALAKHGSFKKAAEELFVSQPTLSIFLNRLEERLGIRLFDRIGKKLVPTYAGEIYVRRAKEMMMIGEQCDAELSNLITGYTGRIRLGVHSRRSAYLLPSVLTAFAGKYPGIDVVLEENGSSAMEHMLLDGELDLIISNRYFQKEKLELFPLYKDCILVCLPAGHPAKAFAKELPGHVYPWLDLKYLENERFIIQKPYQSIRDFTNIALMYCNVKPTRTFLIENLETATQMAAEGYGVSFNYQSYLRYFSYKKPIICFETGYPDLSIPIFAATRKDAVLPVHTKALITLLEEAFKLDAPDA